MKGLDDALERALKIRANRASLIMRTLDDSLQTVLANRARRRRIEEIRNEEGDSDLNELHRKVSALQRTAQSAASNHRVSQNELVIEVKGLRSSVEELLKENGENFDQMTEVIHQDIIDQIDEVAPIKGEDYFTSEEVNEIIKKATKKALKETKKLIPEIPEIPEPVDLTQIRKDIEELKNRKVEKPEKFNPKELKDKIKALEAGILNRFHGGQALQFESILVNGVSVASNVNKLNFVGPTYSVVNGVPTITTSGTVGSNFDLQTFTATAGQTVYTLANIAAVPEKAWVKVCSQLLVYGVDYTIAGTTLTLVFTDYAIEAGDVIQVQYFY